MDLRTGSDLRRSGTGVEPGSVSKTGQFVWGPLNRVGPGSDLDARRSVQLCPYHSVGYSFSASLHNSNVQRACLYALTEPLSLHPHVRRHHGLVRHMHNECSPFELGHLTWVTIACSNNHCCLLRATSAWAYLCYKIVVWYTLVCTR